MADLQPEHGHTDTPDGTTGTGSAPQIDTSVAHPARRYNYWLGGKDNFAADRESGDAIAAAYPAVRLAAQANRAFLGRAARFVAEQGVRQFLDIGTGLPAPGNTHGIVQAVDPACRVVYVDNDPIVLTHARALLTGATPDTVAYLHADLADPATILTYLHDSNFLDLTRPVALQLVAVLHFLPDDADPHGIVTALLDALAPGSYLVLSHGTADFLAPAERAALPALAPGLYPRSRADIAAFTTGLDLIEPGLVGVADWRPDTDTIHHPVQDIGVYGAVARRPAR